MRARPSSMTNLLCRQEVTMTSRAGTTQVKLPETDVHHREDGSDSTGADEMFKEMHSLAEDIRMNSVDTLLPDNLEKHK